MRTSRQHLQDATEQVLVRKREYLDTLIRNYVASSNALVELDTTERQLINVTEDYQNYIDERVLWIRSAQPLYKDARLDDSDYELLNAAAWLQVAAGLVADMRRNVLLYLMVGGMFIVLLAFNLRFRRDISKQAKLPLVAIAASSYPRFVRR